jgi:threonine dehydratase
LNAVIKLAEASPGSRPRLVTASAGNHGRALAHAAQEAGMPLVVYAPAAAPRVKLDAIRHLGAELRLCDDYDEAERAAKRHGASGDALFISPYSHPDIIAGAGTVGLEILEARPDVEVIVVSIGGGGLISGIATAASAQAEVVGVEVEASCPFTRSLAAGHIVTIEVGPTLADGLSGNLDPDTITFAMVRERVSRIAVIEEKALENAVVSIVREERLIAEGAGAAGVAAIASGKIDVRNRRVAVVLSGANIDPEKIGKVWTANLAADDLLS